VNIINHLISDFLDKKISYATLEDALKQAIDTAQKNNISITEMEKSIDNTELNRILSTLEITKLKQLFQHPSDDKTIIRQAGENETVLASPPNVENDSDKTVIHQTQTTNIDETILSDKTRIQPETIIKPDNTNTILAPHATATTQSNNKLAHGRIINNRFVLEKLLGQGGMGSVFKARDLRKEEANDSNSHIAIKFLNEDFKQHPQALISLQREAKKSQALAHPNIITVHDFDRDGDTVYMTMEYLDGSPLDEYLIDHKHTGVKKEDAIKFIDDMSRALSYAHQKNIVHSDFKPGNVFITKDGTAKVLDFGIARAVQHIGEQNASGQSVESGANKTQFDAGDLGGLTPAYASCEMLEGKHPSPSDDIYALGCVAYELLIGEHPFLKKPATRARDENLTPALVKQLDKKQSNALLHTLQFSNETRTQDAQTFIREFFVKKHNSKILLGTLAVAAFLLIGVGIKFFLDYQQRITIETLITEVQKGDRTTITYAIPALNALEGETRETVLSEVRPMVIQYYASKALPLADQSKGKYNFPRALATLRDAKRLYPDSAQVNELIIELTNSQNQLLNALASQIDKFLQKGKLTAAVYNNEIQDIADLLKIAAPQSPLLKDPRIQLAYVRETRSALKINKLDEANILIKSALSLLSNDKELLALENNIKQREAQAAEDQKLLSLQKQLKEDGKTISDAVRTQALKRHTEKLTSLISGGFTGKSWLTQVQSEITGLNAFAQTRSDKQQTLQDEAATLIAQQARKIRRENQLTDARNLLKQAENIAPGLSILKREKRALNIAERKQQKIFTNKEKSAKIASLKKSLLNQANADDVKDALKTYKALKMAAPNSHFVKIEATEAIANAYLRLANGLAARKDYKSAIQLADSGAKIAPHYISAKDKKKEYLAETAIINLYKSLEDINAIDINKSKQQLKIIKQGLPDRLEIVQAKASKQVLKRIKKIAVSDRDKAKTLVDIARRIFPENQEITALTKRSSKFQSSGGQPCKTTYAGHGKRTRASCFDMISNDIQAPLMIVIPAASPNQPAFAISKHEVSINDFNHYCLLSKECVPSKANDLELPISQVSIKHINHYLKWLSEETDQLYQLPTDDQWLHAASANGKQQKLSVNCRLMQGNKQIKGNNLLDVKSGKQNEWGLKNHIGNVQELVMVNDKYVARGGAYTDSFSKCDISLKRPHSGKADSITGFRIIKVLQK